MDPKIRCILIVANLAKEHAEEMTGEVQSYLHEQAIDVRIHTFYGKPEAYDFSGIDLIISLGGDGTVLYCAREVYSLGIPIMAVNLGNFGFITEVASNEWKDAFEAYRQGQLSISERLLLKSEVHRGGKRIGEFVGLNDTVINNQGLSKLIRFRTMCDGSPLGVYRSDGIIVATPTGSTAYSAAAGGPILDPRIEGIIINPICPFTLSNRPIVVPAKSEILIEIEMGQKTAIAQTIDGQTTMALQPGDLIRITSASKKVRLIRSDRRNFYEVLRSKLNWTGGPDA